MSSCKHCGKPLVFARSAGGAALPMHEPPKGRAVGSVYCDERTARGTKAEERGGE
jgi:hypothetical protein